MVYLSNGEFTTMQVLWGSNRPMKASEIADILGVKQSYVINTLNHLSSIDFVETDQVIRVAKTFARTFKTKISEMDYYLDLLKGNKFQNDKKMSAELIAFFFNYASDEETLEELKAFMEQRKNEIE